MNKRYCYDCPKCGVKYWSGSQDSISHLEASGSCPVCQRQEILRAEASGLPLRFPTTHTEAEDEYLSKFDWVSLGPGAVAGVRK